MRLLFALLLGLCLTLPAAAQQPTPADPDVLLQGFYWNVHPGDAAQNNDGVWWDSLRTQAQTFVDAGVQTVWIPSPFKGLAGRWSMGYDVYDYYDLGAFENKFTRRTRFGTVEEFDAMMDEFDRVGLRKMVDAVLNHRDGGDSQSRVDCWYGAGQGPLRFNVFNPGSGRFPATARNFHPNGDECNEDPPYNDPVFAQDQAYFTDLNTTLDPGASNGGWFYGPHRLGFNADSLVTWGRYLFDDLEFDEVRVDAIKHIDPAFLAPWLVEVRDGSQPYAVGEFFGSNFEIQNYIAEVNRFNSSFPEPGAPGRDANLAGFDFGLRFALKDMANSGGFYDMRNLNAIGLHFNGVDPFRVATFVDNHDFDRIGYVGADCNDPEAIRFGLTCLKFSIDSGHDPVVSRKNLGYAYIMAAEGRPTVFYKDFVWFGLEQELTWLMALRRTLGQGESTPLGSLNPNPELPQADVFVLRREGFGTPRYGSLMVINDNGNAKLGGFVDSPHTNFEFKDYTDSFLFTTTQVFADSRVRVEAEPSNYAWYAPTGLYPRTPGMPAPAFEVESAPGGKLQFVVLRAENAASLQVNGASIQPGDEVAVIGPSGDVTKAAGLGRIGLATQWDGVHDMVIEVLGNDAPSRLAAGAPLRLAVYDASAGTYLEAGEIAWAPTGTGFTFNPDRPASRGGAFPLTVGADAGTYAAGTISYVTAFSAGATPPPSDDDEAAPLVSGQINGREYNGTVRDDRADDTGVASVVLREATNLNLAVDPFSAGASSVGFTITLVSARQQGKGFVVATDVAGNEAELWICSNGCPPPDDPPPPPPPGDDTTGPALSGSVKGAKFDGTATDSGSGIASVTLGDDAVNLNLSVDSFTAGASSVGFELTLIDRTQPGSGTIVATDVEGNEGTLFVDSENRREAAASLAALKTMEPEIETALLGNHPNPFNPTTLLRFTLAEPMPVTLAVYDVLGREVAVLVEGEYQPGLHEVAFDATALPSGVYFYRLDTPEMTASKRMLLLK
ncbi:MAG: T9SS type A sorting domain-containing protein [Bacteroidota bacterium]